MPNLGKGFRYHSLFYVNGKLGVWVAYHGGVFFDFYKVLLFFWSFVHDGKVCTIGVRLGYQYYPHS